jgi:Protein of unknown function (DUF3800)
LYIDDCGDEGDWKGIQTTKGGSSRIFTLGGIIVNSTERHLFSIKLQEIITEFFTGIVLPVNFKLHYVELREAKVFPYVILEGLTRKALADRVFDAIKSINCSLISISIDLENHCKKYLYPVKPRAYALYLMLERFQYFLLDYNRTGYTVYERYNPFIKRQVKYTHDYFIKNVSFPKYVNFDNILGGIMNGDPVSEPILQFADFFAFAPYKKHESKGRYRDRYDQIRNKYYNLDYSIAIKRGNYEI